LLEQTVASDEYDWERELEKELSDYEPRKPTDPKGPIDPDLEEFLGS